MKIRLYAAGMIALLVITMLAGCAASAKEIQPQSPAESTAPPAVAALPPETQAPATQPPATQPTRITPEEAEAIALNHAGLTADQVSYMRTEFDYDDGRAEYDIEFRKDGWEYDYEIHAQTGEILRQEAEPPATAAPTAAPTPTRITPEEAEAIALKHAGLTADQVSYMRTEFDYDDGRPEYDIEFRRDGWEYDYEIHAETGEILRQESEPPEQKKTTKTKTAETQPKETTPPATKAKETKSSEISKDEAISIALKHAGLSKSQVKGLRAESDYDDGRLEYDVEFRYDGYEYDYEIHGQSGKILSWDKDWDD